MLILFDCKLSAKQVENHGIIYVHSGSYYSFENILAELRAENQFYQKGKTLSDEYKIGLKTNFIKSDANINSIDIDLQLMVSEIC